jgi:hypothetical protein
MATFRPGIAAAAAALALAIAAPAAPVHAAGLTDPGVTDISARRKKRVVTQGQRIDWSRDSYRPYGSHQPYGYDHPYRVHGYHPRPGGSIGLGSFGIHD